MKQMQIAKAARTKGAVSILKKLIAEVESDIKLKMCGKVGDVWENYWLLEPADVSDSYENIQAFGQFTRTDFALELMGNRLWLFSVHVVART